MEAYLSKKNKLVGWTKYWFVIEGPLMAYYKEKKRTHRAGSIDLQRIHQIQSGGPSHPLHLIVTSNNSSTTLKAETREQCELWMEALREAKSRHGSRRSHFTRSSTFTEDESRDSGVFPDHEELEATGAGDVFHSPGSPAPDSTACETASCATPDRSTDVEDGSAVTDRRESAANDSYVTIDRTEDDIAQDPQASLSRDPSSPTSSHNCRQSDESDFGDYAQIRSLHESNSLVARAQREASERSNSGESCAYQPVEPLPVSREPDEAAASVTVASVERTSTTVDQSQRCEFPQLTQLEAQQAVDDVKVTADQLTAGGETSSKPIPYYTPVVRMRQKNKYRRHRS